MIAVVKVVTLHVSASNANESNSPVGDKVSAARESKSAEMVSLSVGRENNDGGSVENGDDICAISVVVVLAVLGKTRVSRSDLSVITSFRAERESSSSFPCDTSSLVDLGKGDNASSEVAVPDKTSWLVSDMWVLVSMPSGTRGRVKSTGVEDIDPIVSESCGVASGVSISRVESLLLS